MNYIQKIIIVLVFLSYIEITPANAFWVWTPETNQWINPKYAVKDTPSEQLELALKHYHAKEYEDATRELNKLIKHYPRAREAPQAQYYLGACLEEQEDLFGAFKAYQTVIDKYPFSELSASIVEKQYKIGLAMLEGQAQSRGSFLNAFVGVDTNVVEVFEAVIKNAPYGELAPLSKYKIGLYFMEKTMYQEARDAFEGVINDYPDSEWAKAAKYQIALSDAKRSSGAEYDQKITKAAVEEFNDFVEQYPEAELSDKAKKQIHELREKEAENAYVIARFYERQKNYKAAKIYYQNIVENYTDSKLFKKALEKMREMAQKETE